MNGNGVNIEEPSPSKTTEAPRELQCNEKMCEMQEICDEGEEDCNNDKDDIEADADVRTTSIPSVVVGIMVVVVFLLVAVFIVYFAVCREKKTGTLPISSEGARASKKTRNVNV